MPESHFSLLSLGWVLNWYLSRFLALGARDILQLLSVLHPRGGGVGAGFCFTL